MDNVKTQIKFNSQTVFNNVFEPNSGESSPFPSEKKVKDEFKDD